MAFDVFHHRVHIALFFHPAPPSIGKHYLLDAVRYEHYSSTSQSPVNGNDGRT